MTFQEKLEEYIEQLDCTAKMLSERSGLSTATISRYRSGDRVPEADSDNLANLVTGIVRIAGEKGLSEFTIQTVTDSFLPYGKSKNPNIDNLQKNLNTLLSILPVNISELAKYINYDASYISRIRNGQRQPANPQQFISGVSHFVARRYQDTSKKALIADMIGCSLEELQDLNHYQTQLSDWLANGSNHSKDQMTSFLHKMDDFNLDEYICAIHFDELKVPSVPFQFPTSKSYFGLQEMMDSELAFLKATVLSKSTEPVTMYSDMPMSEMAKDPDFPKKWMFGMAMMLKKGLHLNQIHNIDRSFDDMMLGLESWIPMYMSGQISPYYLKSVQGTIFSSLLKVSGNVALTGEAINGYHSEGKYYLTKNKSEVAYYKKRAEQLLSKAAPLMEIYRVDRAQAYNFFLDEDAKKEGARYYILSAFSLHTLSEDLLDRILCHNQIPQVEQEQIRQYISDQKAMANIILSHSSITEEISVLSREEFEQSPMVLPLSGLFYEKDVLYRWEDYTEHWKLALAYQQQNFNYHIVENTASAFRNVQIYIHKGKWVLVSKNKTPAIHFLIRHPKMRHAFENMVIPIRDDSSAPKNVPLSH
mgnify:FL=1